MVPGVSEKYPDLNHTHPTPPCLPQPDAAAPRIGVYPTGEFFTPLTQAGYPISDLVYPNPAQQYPTLDFTPTGDFFYPT